MPYDPWKFLLERSQPKSKDPRKALAERVEQMKELGLGVAPALWDPEGALEQHLEASARELAKPGKGGRPRFFTEEEGAAVATRYKTLRAQGLKSDDALVEIETETGAARSTVLRAISDHS